MSGPCRIAITCGEPAGVGAEVALKALGDPPPGVEFVLVGPKPVWEAAWGLLPGPPPPLPITAPLPLCSEADWSWGSPTALSGELAAAAVECAALMALRGEVQALVTAPLTKVGLRKAGRPFSGHTELLEHLCGPGSRATMMLAGARLRVVLVTTHLSLAEVPRAVTMKRVLAAIGAADRGLRDDLGIPKPRIAVAGLNPHAGESGVLGTEEANEISPAVGAAREQGIGAEGPLPADTVFFAAAEGRFDAVVAMYHDQGLGPFKLLHFHDGVNVTLGLPIVRTSPDHGTAFDIAGRGVARAESFRAAVRTAWQIAERRQRRRPET